MKTEFGNANALITVFLWADTGSKVRNSSVNICGQSVGVWLVVFGLLFFVFFLTILKPMYCQFSCQLYWQLTENQIKPLL